MSSALGTAHWAQRTDSSLKGGRAAYWAQRRCEIDPTLRSRMLLAVELQLQIAEFKLLSPQGSGHVATERQFYDDKNQISWTSEVLSICWLC